MAPGLTQDPVQGLAPAPEIVAPGPAVDHAVALVPALPGTDLQRIVHLETGPVKDPEIEVLRTDPAPETVDVHVHQQTGPKVVLAPGLVQGAGKISASRKLLILHLLKMQWRQFYLQFCFCNKCLIEFLMCFITCKLSVFCIVTPL